MATLHDTVTERTALAARKIRRWALWGAPLRVIVLVIAVDAAALLGSSAAIARNSVNGDDLLRFGLLATLSVTYLEVARQVEHRRRLLSGSGVVQSDISSVWTFPAAVLLPAKLAVALVALTYVHSWIRAWGRVDGARLYRTVYSASVAALTCLAVSALVHTVHTVHTVDNNWLPARVGGAVSVVLAIIAYWLVNSALLAAAMVVSGRATSELLGSWSENALEFATLGLGGITVALVVTVPLLAAIVLPAIFLLQHHALLAQLVQAATIDAKTELLNAAAWRRLAQRELERAERQRTTTAVLVIDMDHFKHINDTCGHLAGDTALKAVGEALADELRDYDAVGRFGGEEFVALLPGVDGPAARSVGERIRRRIESLSVTVERRVGEYGPVRVTASVGVAAASGVGIDLDDLLRAADDALYAAKDDGRNAVRLARVDTAIA